MTDRVGQQLGNYRLIRLLGRGSFAEVYLGEHLHLKSYAALKVLRAALSDEDVARFLAEGQTLARLTHPQIVRVHDFAVEQGTPFLVMDYAPKGTLRQRYPQGSCLSLDTVVTYVKHIATALQYAHNRHMIHRDVKPENMLLGNNQEVLLSDFGLALFSPSPELLSTQEMAGTLPYMAPEQWRGKPCFASDQYALGVVTYEWLCGVRPFNGSYWQLLNQHVSALPPTLREKDPSLPEAVESVVLKALAKDPGQRYVSMQLFAQALERASQTRVDILRNNPEITGPIPVISPTPPVTLKRIFLSNSPADDSFVARLQADSQRRGIIVWNEQHSSTPDTLDQEPENILRQAIRAVDVVVLVVSSHTRTSHIVKEHLRIAALYQRRLIYVWATGEDLASLLPEVKETAAPLDVIDARETRYKQALDELVASLQKEPDIVALAGAGLAPVSEETADKPRNPYKGLRAFTENDALDFFGRETLIGELVDSMVKILESEQSSPSSARLLAVIGPSGSGKSSVVMAGLLPRLRQNALPGSGEWVYLSPMVPGARPVEALALTLASHLPDRSLKSILEDLADDSARGLHLLASRLVKGSEKKIVLFIDQFEEAFNLTALESEREHFFALLLAAITERKGSILVILTLRADFYDRLMVSKALGRLISQHQSLVWPMEVDELRTAIKGPALLPDVLLSFEGNLLGDLLYEVRGQVGALPLLQFTLDQLFERRKDRVLTQQAYQEIGGVRGALAQHAERVYQSLPTQTHQQLGRALFSRLIDPGTLETDATKRRIPLSAFILSDPAKTEVLTSIIEIFTKKRLLTINTLGEASMVEVSHEALIGAWTRLQDWLREARDTIRLQQTINTDASAWREHKCSTDRLYRGAQLAEALLWRETNIPNIDEDAFLQASLEEQQSLQAQEHVRRQRYTRRSIIISAVGVTGMVGTGLLVYLLRANPTSPPQPIQTPKSLPFASNGHTGPVHSAAWSSDGKHIASASADSTVRIWNASNGKILFICTGHTRDVYSVAWSPDSRHVASASGDGTVRIWDAGSGLTLLTYTGHAIDVYSAAWSSDGKRIASAGYDGKVRIWDAGNGQTLLSTGFAAHVYSVAWSPDGKRLASASADQIVRIWDTGSGQTLLTCSGHTDQVNSVAWFPDGKRIVSASDDWTLRLWDAGSGQTLLSYIGHTDNVKSVALSPDSKSLISASSDRTLRLWDTGSGQTLLTYSGHTDHVNSAAWSPDSRSIISASSDKTLRLWDARLFSGRRALTYTGHTQWVTGVVWSPDGHRLASASYDKTVRIWDAGNGQTLLTDHTGILFGVAWSPDGKRIASAGYDQTVRIWDAGSGQILLTYTGHTDRVSKVAWSPDGKRVASGSFDATVRIWDADSGLTLLIYTGHTNVVEGLAWSPDGHSLASCGDTTRIWDANSGLTLFTYTPGYALMTGVEWSPDGHQLTASIPDTTVRILGSGPGMNGVAWSPDGKRIASSSYDKTVRIWDASSGLTLLTYTGHTDGVFAVAWSPDGRRIASTGYDKTVRIWDASSGLTLLTYTGHTDSVFSVAWSPEGKRVASAGNDTTVQVWLWLED